MKYIIVSGSNRKDSQSLKVSKYIKEKIEKEGDSSEILNFEKQPLEMWTEDMWDKDSEQYKKWQTLSEKIKQSDGLVFVSPEWNGQTSPVLKNFLMHLSFSEVAHKPALIVGVSSGVSGTYPIAEMRAFSAKNSGLLYIPDHVIVRDVNNVLNDTSLDSERTNDFSIKKRIERSLSILNFYGKHMKNLRDEADFDFSDYPYGM